MMSAHVRANGLGRVALVIAGALHRASFGANHVAMEGFVAHDRLPGEKAGKRKYFIM